MVAIKKRKEYHAEEKKEYGGEERVRRRGSSKREMRVGKRGGSTEETEECGGEKREGGQLTTKTASHLEKAIESFTFKSARLHSINTCTHV